MPVYRQNRPFLKTQGQGLLEYIAITALVAIVSIGAIKLLGTRVKNQLTKVTNSFDRTMRNGLRSSTHDDNEEDFPHDDPAPSKPRSHTIKLPF